MQYPRSDVSTDNVADLIPTHSNGSVSVRINTSNPQPAGLSFTNLNPKPLSEGAGKPWWKRWVLRPGFVRSRVIGHQGIEPRFINHRLGDATALTDSDVVRVDAKRVGACVGESAGFRQVSVVNQPAQSTDADGASVTPAFNYAGSSALVFTHPDPAPIGFGDFSEESTDDTDRKLFFGKDGVGMENVIAIGRKASILIWHFDSRIVNLLARLQLKLRRAFQFSHNHSPGSNQIGGLIVT
jgi:hypothetical protein